MLFVKQRDLERQARQVVTLGAALTAASGSQG